MQQKKSHNNNFKRLIICYGCNQKSHIKKNYLIFKFKKLHLKIKNMVSYWKFNNIKFKNVKIFNMIYIIIFLENNIDKPWKKKLMIRNL